MNSHDENNSSDAATTGEVSTSLAPDGSNPKRRSRSNIAKLPKVLRDLINSMLDDGAPYGLIVEKLQQSTDPSLPYPISEMNISRWYDTGYQDHLAQQERLAYVRLTREAALEMVAGDDTATLPEATLQIIASHYYELLGDFSPALLKGKLSEDPLKYTRFINGFARLAREILNLKKYRETSAKTVAAELKRLDPARELTDREDELITERMDDFFLKPRRRRKEEEEEVQSPSSSVKSTMEDKKSNVRSQGTHGEMTNDQ